MKLKFPEEVNWHMCHMHVLDSESQQWITFNKLVKQTGYLLLVQSAKGVRGQEKYATLLAVSKKP